jgi:hypothetical protein
MNQTSGSPTHRRPSVDEGPSALSCVKCLQKLDMHIETPGNLLQGLINPHSNNTVYQYALPGQPQITPVICHACYSNVSPHYPVEALCYVCESNKVQKRYEFVVSFAYMRLNVYTLICSAKCRARHEIFARKDLHDNGGHVQIINDAQLLLEIENEISKIQSSS